MSFVKKISLLLISLLLQSQLLYSEKKTLINALIRNNTTMAEQLLCSSTPPTQQEKNEALVYASGCLSIITTSHNGRGTPQPDMVRILLEHGANPNYISKAICNMTPLQLASAKGRFKTVMTLLEYNADIHMINSENCNALSRAIEGKHHSIAFELLRRGAVEAVQTQPCKQRKLTCEQLKPAYQRLHTIYEPLQEQHDLPKVLAQLVLKFDGTNSLLPGYEQLVKKQKKSANKNYL